MKPTDSDIPKIETKLVSASEMLRLEAERQAENTPEARSFRLAKEWHDAGMRAYREGKARTDYPFKRHLRRYGLDAAWQIGWDTGALLDAMKAGGSAKLGDACPYEDPFLAAHWRQGWHATYGLQIVGGTKNPASREQDAKPGHF
ncbi:MAG: hypothetical protein ABTR07_07860 [Candidatus Competibacter denitrificans]